MVTWLADGGFRIGELCGLHLADLHLRDGAGCGQCRAPHVHVCHRDGNPNRAAAKTKHPWQLENGIITGGLIKRASPEMIHAYFEYVTTEYPERRARHAAGAAARRERGAAVGAGCGPRDAAPGRDPGRARQGHPARVPARICDRGARARSCIGCNIPRPA